MPSGRMTVASARGCCARIGDSMPAGAPRRGARCGNRASCLHSVVIGTELVVVPLCRLHMRKLLASTDPAALVQSWALHEC
jgi:hypothetical protein